MSDSSCHLLSGILLPFSWDFCSQRGRKCSVPLMSLPGAAHRVRGPLLLNAAHLSPTFFQLWVTVIPAPWCISTCPGQAWEEPQDLFSVLLELPMSCPWALISPSEAC